MDSQHMQIGEVADRTGLSLRTIRYYEEVGLLAPTARTTGGFRLYADADVTRLELIKRMKPLDFSLEETRALLEVLDGLEDPTSAGDPALLARLEEFHDAALGRVAAVRERLAIADGFAAHLAEQLTRHGGTSR
ncbi:MerR family transcriptional regulator [Nocardioides panacisoli]|uniref:MerR family transcriptional regulator n=1 Tax=Nocardioides panacisoli TaxID=627624 RepID=UPI001C6358C0|nr:MerR family transcriptional regulator [Nocardioides panacisoli]QYJ03396.1 MerR family transcriptional regulator [Nocardioides panacisoli]